jgi:hypothetical protein
VSASPERPEIVVVSPLKEWTCSACGDTDAGWLIMDDDGPLCLSCADLAHLTFLGAGDAALTRRARKHSRALRRRRAFQPCAQTLRAPGRAVEDADFERELANEIGRLFPGCPAECVKEIASHTSRRGSGRVGRTASARALDPTAITLAVAAAARHRESDYDDLLMAGVDRSEARERVRATVGSVLEAWRTPPG